VQKDLGNFVEQVFILRNARGVEFLGNLERHVSLWRCDVIQKKVIGTLFATGGVVEWRYEKMGFCGIMDIKIR